MIAINDLSEKARRCLRALRFTVLSIPSGSFDRRHKQIEGYNPR